MEVRDLRQLAVSVLAIAAALVLWLVLVRLQAGGIIDVPPTRQALTAFTMQGWLWFGVAAMAVLLVLFILAYYGVPSAPPGYAEGAMRQVQCDECLAVFFLHDTGHRPLTHVCPNCKAVGIYDGSDPVGTLEDVRPLNRVPCGHCRTDIAFTGRMPEELVCPSCGAVGRPA